MTKGSAFRQSLVFISLGNIWVKGQSLGFTAKVILEQVLSESSMSPWRQHFLSSFGTCQIHFPPPLCQISANLCILQNNMASFRNYQAAPNNGQSLASGNAE